MHNSLSLTLTKTQLSTRNLWQMLSADLKISSRYQDVNFLDGSEITVKPELKTTSNNNHMSTTTTNKESRFPLNNDHLSTTATIFVSQGWSLNTGLIVLEIFMSAGRTRFGKFSRKNHFFGHFFNLHSIHIL
jgi:hypothetical protein